MARPRRPRRRSAETGQRLPGEPTVTAVRAHCEPDDWRAFPAMPLRQWPQVSLVLHTVAYPRPGEPLHFGVWRLVHRDGAWMGERAGVFHDDDLPAEEVAELGGLCALRGLTEPQTRKEFVDETLYRACFKRELPLVSLFVPIDVGRLAVDWSKADNGGISHTIWTHPKPRRRARGAARRRPVLANGEVENSARPRIVVLMLDGQRPLIAFTRTANPDPADLIAEGSDGKIDPRYTKPGRFHSLAMHASALAGERIETLADACRAFGVDFPPADAGNTFAARLDSALAALETTVALQERLLSEHECVAAGLLAPDRAYSSASYGRAFYDGAGFKPPLLQNPDFPRWALAAGMGAFFGGECFVGIRMPLADLPCVFCDYTSLYPVVAKLGGLDEFLKAEHLEIVEEDPAEVAAWLASLDREKLLDPEFHRSIALRFVEVTPEGQWLPHRVPAGKHWKLQVGPLYSQEPRSFALPDAVRATLIGGPPLRIARAFRVVAHWRQRELRPVRLPSGRIVNPDEDLPFALAEERFHESGSWQGAKRCANTCNYGLFVQTDTSETPGKKQLQHVWLPDGRKLLERGEDVERPARWYFPPLAASVAAGARLFHYLARDLFERDGGTVAYGDTDALAVVATPTGGPIPCPGGTTRSDDGTEQVTAVSFELVQQVCDRLEVLNPFRDQGDSRPPLLKIEADNIDQDGALREAYLHARSTKNYDRYVNGDDTVELTKASEHGLGHLYPHWSREDGRDWIREGRRYLLHVDKGRHVAAPAFFDELAVSVVRANNWAELKRFEPNRSRRRRGRQIRPFARIAIAHTDPLYRDETGNRVIPVAPWHDRLTPNTASWRNLATGQELKLRPTSDRVRERDLTPSSTVPVQTLRDVFNRLAQRHDHNLDAHGHPATSRTTGIVTVPTTQSIATIVIGRETNDTDRVGVTTDPAYRTYTNPDGEAWRLARDVLRIRALGLLPPGRPREADKPDLIRTAGELARRELITLGETNLPTDPVACCHVYLARRGSLRVTCDGCGRYLDGGARRWCADCRPHRRKLSR